MKNLNIAISLLVGIIAHNANADQVEFNLDHDGATRSYHLYIPTSYKKGKPTPLLIALHGRPSNGQRMANLTSFNARADKHEFVVVYPEGIGSQWNYLHGVSGYKEQPNDSDFLLKLVDVVVNDYSIDESRIYVTGISNGGFMAQRLACYAPTRFAAFASVAAGGYGAMPVECENGKSINMLYMHGTADDKVPWKGLGIQDENGNRELVTMSIVNSVKFWSSRNQCGQDVTSREMPRKGNSSGTFVKVLSSNACLDDTEVILYAIVGGGHNWPGAPGIIPASIAGRVNLDIHASDVIWSFFKTKKLN